MLKLSSPDLAQHPPRGPRVKLGGFVHLPRLIDKVRAAAAGKLGEYIYPCPFDQRFFAFTGIDPQALLEEVKKGGSDTDVLAWVNAQLRPARLPYEIKAWSDWLSQLSIGDARRHRFFADTIDKLAPGREDITTYFDLLDLDDYVSFSGRP